METISRSLLTFLLNALWQIPLLAGVAWLACRWMRNGPAADRHAVWIATLLAALVVPVVSTRTGAEQVPSYAAPAVRLESPQPSAVAPPPPARRVTGALPERSVPLGRTTAVVLIAAYLLFVLFRLGRLTVVWLRTARLRESAYSAGASPQLAALWRRAETVFGLSGVELRWSASVSGPVTAGRTVILPESLRQETSEDVLAAAVGHEMAHIARRDYAMKVLVEILASPISFHPAALMVRRGIDRTRELACDELVASRLLEPSVYARSIVRIAKTITGAAQPGCTLGVLDGDILEERIRRLVEGRCRSLKRARMPLVAGVSALAVCIAVAAGLAVSARAQSAAYPEVKAGVEAYNLGDFNAAVAHFQQAVNLDPNYINARLHFANALVHRFAADPKTYDREAVLQQTTYLYQEVLSRDPGNASAILGMVALSGPAKPKESHDLMLQIIEKDPANKNAYYAAAVFDWQMAYPELMRARQAAGMRPQDPGIIPGDGVRAGLRTRLMPVIEDGFRMLQIALNQDGGWSDAMAYMNLLHREKAMLMDSSAEHDAQIAQADDWVRKALEAKRRERSQPKPSSQITPDAPPPQVVPPPPPPPPPPPGSPPGNPRERGGQ
jgi:beta-lactamase regulating signal transducer with metallopeptidase domain